uniref:glucan endo-1,3-beta-D-glucosidase n=1 Tax=Hyaloperonospora arabidopsidis (strain Emoy2) TaxID=559515 RepID=M4BGZ3_HYAAE
MPLAVVLTTCLFAAAATAETVEFINKCSFPIELYHSQKGSAATKITDIPCGESFSKEVSGPAHMFRHSSSPSSTLVELACDDWLWYDISIIPPMPGWCASYEECKIGGKKGFNIPISIKPKANIGKSTCAHLECAADDKKLCADAYHFPMDNIKTHSCPVNTGLEVTFCYDASDDSGNSGDQYTHQEPVPPHKQGVPELPDTPGQDDNIEQDEPLNPAIAVNATIGLPSGPLAASKHDDSEDPTQQDPTQQDPTQQDPSQETPGLGEVKVTYSYKGEFAGNVPGSYNRVVELQGCVKEPVSIQSPVGPMSEPVSMIFRAPLVIEHISVFVATDVNVTWTRDSFYSRKEGLVENMVFMNNMKPDYSGKGGYGPQSFASEDGKSAAEEPTVFNGVLEDASSPLTVGGGPGISTGTEINILTGKKCDSESCLGFFGVNNYQGWGGGKKAFVTEVMMPLGPTVNQPAMWMLNAQVMQSNQYDPCNCRGMGPVGGCGELDIAEVIETNPARDMVTTHYYFYDGAILSPKGDNFAPRSYDQTTVYVTLIDDSNEGLIKIVELASFDFSITDLGPLYQQLVDC